MGISKSGCADVASSGGRANHGGRRINSPNALTNICASFGIVGVHQRLHSLYVCEGSGESRMVISSIPETPSTAA